MHILDNKTRPAKISWVTPIANSKTCLDLQVVHILVRKTSSDHRGDSDPRPEVYGHLGDTEPDSETLQKKKAGEPDHRCARVYKISGSSCGVTHAIHGSNSELEYATSKRNKLNLGMVMVTY